MIDEPSHLYVQAYRNSIFHLQNHEIRHTCQEAESGPHTPLLVADACKCLRVAAVFSLDSITLCRALGHVLVVMF